MEVILERVIHPVGQGGFYTETFTFGDPSMFSRHYSKYYNDVNMVYDCGSETNKPHGIKAYLDKYFLDSSKRIDIDVVFISHLHEDHINGLDYLLKRSKVKYLFLPQLTPNMVIEAILYNTINSDDFDNISNTCISNLIQRRYENVNVIEINELDEERRHYEGEPIPIRGGLSGTYNSGTIFTINDVYNVNRPNRFSWLYIPFNSPIVSKKGLISKDAQFASAIDSNGKVDPEILKNLVKKIGINECKKLYTHYFGRQHNSYSMTLFSGIKDFNHKKIYCNKSSCCCCECLRKCDCKKSPNFLYTGDFMPNKKSNKIPFGELLKNNLDKMGLWQSISGIQVPHHGSRDNNYSELYQYPCIGYISAGSKNTYHHPNVDTLVSMQKECCKPVIVSEDIASRQFERYSL